jgi:hypothetical protein
MLLCRRLLGLLLFLHSLFNLAKQQGKGRLVGCPLPVLRSAFFELDGRAYGLPDENISGEFEPSTQLPHLF